MYKPIIKLIFWYLIYQGKIEEAKDKSDPEAFEEAVEEEMQRLLGYFLKELEQGYEHCGDCIKVSCSCAKCWAESFIDGWEWSIDSYIGHYIDQAFRDQRTLNQAIQWLESYNVEPREDGYHIRWMECAKDAAIWLKEYKDEWNLEGNGGSERGAYYEMNEDKYELVDWL